MRVLDGSVLSSCVRSGQQDGMKCLFCKWLKKPCICAEPVTEERWLILRCEELGELLTRNHKLNPYMFPNDGVLGDKLLKKAERLRKKHLAL
jgi:hypothetical protein